MKSAAFVLLLGAVSAQPQIHELLPQGDAAPSAPAAEVLQTTTAASAAASAILPGATEAATVATTIPATVAPILPTLAQAVTTPAPVVVATVAATPAPVAGAAAAAAVAASVSTTPALLQTTTAAAAVTIAPLGSTAAPSATTVNIGNAMAGLLNSVIKVDGNADVHGAFTGTPPPAGALSGASLSQDAMAVVSGLISTFMHKMNLLPGEKACLERNMATLSADLMGTVGNAVTAIRALVEGNGHLEGHATTGVVSAGIDSAMKISSMVASATQLVKSCVHGDALDQLKAAANSLVNGTHLEHRFTVNGVDIARALADSVLAFEEKDFHRFGADIGLALRKITLSNANNATSLPEGVPDKVIIQKATDGLMRGFFVPGSSVEVTDVAHSDIDIKIDLHRCVSANSEFFKELWMATWDLIAQLSLNAEQHGLSGIADMFQQNPNATGEPKWSGELMIAMMQFPMALGNCGINADMQNMFIEALKSLPQIQVHFTFPSGTIKPTEVSSAMARAVVAWSNWNFEEFGYRLGVLFRELIMVAFPEKYAVDASGRLRLSEQTQAEKLNQNSGFGSASVVVGGAGLSVLVALAVVRTRKSQPQLLSDYRTAVMDLEDGDELVE
jgi:hypothetical protein